MRPTLEQNVTQMALDYTQRSEPLILPTQLPAKWHPEPTTAKQMEFPFVTAMREKDGYGKSWKNWVPVLGMFRQGNPFIQSEPWTPEQTKPWAPSMTPRYASAVQVYQTVLVPMTLIPITNMVAQYLK